MPRNKHIEALRPYLVGEQPKEGGEWDMFCPLHDDHQRSAGINTELEVWYCHTGCGGGRLSELIERRDEWREPNGSTPTRKAATEEVPLTEEMVKSWAKELQRDERRLEALMEARGLLNKTIEKYDIGWDETSRAYTLPVRDDDGRLVNVRRYQINPPEGRRKIWSHGTGYGAPRLYPMAALDSDPAAITICEGELDALLTLQHGFPAITRTGAADVWKAEWGEHFADKIVYLCHDADHKGQAANTKIARALRRVAKDVRIMRLPYPVVEKHGKDLTDFWLDGYDEERFEAMQRDAEAGVKETEVEEIDPSDASVLDSFDSRRVGQPLKLKVTIKGKRDPGYSVPRRIKYQCTRDAGSKCAICPMNAVGGDDELEIELGDPVVLEMMDATRGQLHDTMRRHYGAVKCNRLQIEPETFQAVELLFARPSVDHAASTAADYKNMKITSQGRHDTLPNNTVQVTGALFPDPRKQLNEFLAWDIRRLETSIDSVELTKKDIRSLKRFQPKRGQTPLKKLGELARHMAEHVTFIYGRPEMHAMMDLVFHSALSFTFAGRREPRGWLEGIAVGDTRTGKSEAASRLAQHYRAGEVVSCEAASFAGIIGGVQQFGANKEWAITWGVVPMMDRRMCVLDEVGGLQPEEIAAMSDVRSSGIAKLTKIQQEVTHARTRLLWLGNPRNSRMSDYTYGVQALQPLIGNMEDIARFDLAMSVRSGEVDSEIMNRRHDAGELKYDSDLCALLIRWVWSRTADQVVFGKDTERAIFEAAQEMGKRYTDDPPLIQAANVRIKIARTAVALAARLFSTDDKAQRILVRPEHVRDAVAFIDRLYGMPGFGYAERSRETREDHREARRQRSKMYNYLKRRKPLVKFLRSNSSFRRQDLEEIMNVPREDANAIINTLWEARMVRKVKGDVRVQPTLHELLREVK